MKMETASEHNDIKQAVKLRSKVYTAIHKDIVYAYKLAKSIRHPWYRCQALAEVASLSDKNRIVSILSESMNSAMECHDQNRRVTVACWPLHIALKNKQTDLAKIFLKQCISQINQEMDPISKWCAASVVHSIKSDIDLLNKFYITFVNATSKGHGWRVEREIKYLLSDKNIKKDKRYISYLTERQDAIMNWKINNKKRKSS